MEAMYEEDMLNSTEVVLARGMTGVAKPVSSDGRQYSLPSTASAGRLLSGAIGLGSTLSASFSHRRVLQPGESLVVLGGGLALVLLGIIAILLPHLIAWVIAAAVIWPGAGLLLQSLKLWRADKRDSGG
jgi:cardiolipin synthase